MAREGQGYPCCQHDMMMMINSSGTVQANKSRAEGVTCEVGLTTDRDLAEHPCLRNTTSLLLP